MGLESILSGMGSQKAGEYILKATREYLKKRKAKKESERKAAAERAADTYEPPKTQEKKKPKKQKESFSQHGSNIGTSIRDRQEALKEASK